MPDLEKLVGLTITSIDIQKGAKDGTGFVYLEAVGADETPDIDDEIFDYVTSKPYIKKWSEDFAERTSAAGQEVSYGNVRAQHGDKGAQNVAGTVYEPIVWDDKGKSVQLKVKVVDADAITKVRQGAYTGMSIRGRLIGKKWKDGKYQRYTVDPIEWTVCDKPANPNATITVVKADGTTEILKVADKKTRRVDGKDYPKEDFAYVGDPDEPSTWKFLLVNEGFVRAAVRLFKKEKGIPESELAKVKAKIRRAAKRYGIAAPSLEDAEKADQGTELSKGARQIGRVLDSLIYLRDTNDLEAEQITEIFKAAIVLIDENTEEVEDAILMEEVNKGAKSEEVEKASAISRMKAARKAHDENSACLSGYCGHGDVEKCMEKVAENHKAIEAAFKDDKQAKKSAEAEVEKAAKKKEKEKPEDEEEEEDAEDDGDADDKEKKSKKSAKKEAEDGDAAKSAEGDDIKALKAQIASLTAAVEKMAGQKSAKRPTPVHPGAKVVTKADDQPGDKDVVEKMNEVKADDPERVDKLYRIQRDAEPELVKL